MRSAAPANDIIGQGLGQGMLAASSWPFTCETHPCNAGGLGFSTQLALSRDQQLQYGPSFKQLDVLVQPQTAERLYVKIAPPQRQQQQQRWTVPEYIVPR